MLTPINRLKHIQIRSAHCTCGEFSVSWK